MPPFKTPISLRDASVKCVSEMVQGTCLHLRYRHHSEDQQYIEAEKMQKHLVSTIRPLMDEICNYTFQNGNRMVLRDAGNLLFATFMHYNMKELCYTYDPSKRKTSFESDIGLWREYLNKTPNLIKLDLSGVGTEINGILQILGNICLRLEIICFTGYQVADNELLHLSSIKTLREIRNHHSDSLYLTKTGNDLPCIRILLQLLPRLEYIHCSYIGDALLDLTHRGPLALTTCVEMQPTNKKIKAIARLCPKLSRLELGDQFFNQQVLDYKCLIESSIAVTSLKLIDFYFTSDLCDFFLHKGKYLTVLELVNFTDLNLDKITLIGKCCKGIRVLKLYLDPDCRILSPNYIVPERKKIKESCLNDRIFENLLEFELETYADQHNDETNMLTCLAYAKEIQSITFRRQAHESVGNSELLEQILKALLLTNPMRDLQSLILLGPFKLSKETIQYLYNLPHIVKLTLYVVYSLDVDVYLTTITNTNINIDLDISIWLSSRNYNAEP